MRGCFPLVQGNSFNSPCKLYFLLVTIDIIPNTNVIKNDPIIFITYPLQSLRIYYEVNTLLLDILPYVFLCYKQLQIFLF